MIVNVQDVSLCHSQHKSVMVEQCYQASVGRILVIWSLSQHTIVPFGLDFSFFWLQRRQWSSTMHEQKGSFVGSNALVLSWEHKTLVELAIISEYSIMKALYTLVGGNLYGGIIEPVVIHEARQGKKPLTSLGASKHVCERELHYRSHLLKH
ncbi:hypothetical protein DM01DRAFT_1340683 [Hesseltinella vesiculosa]|uniref:Uncharacterized protein n=1 Tax=Hesseltinella vesiculosa TaxID=101127 RepID=A0A1X2G3G1_9FUNG|nr:hypothetical protein DM01DRAFT_1340683 [Hesseltinella vesiculosa]